MNKKRLYLWLLRFLVASKTAWRLSLFFAIFFAILIIAFIYSRPIIIANKTEHANALFRQAVACPNVSFNPVALNPEIKSKVRQGLAMQLQEVIQATNMDSNGNKKPCVTLTKWKTNKGYGATIVFIIAFNVDTFTADNSIAKILIVSHKETPGIGDKIDQNKSNWLLQFIGVTNNTIISKDKKFDTITGATISTKGFTEAVELATDLWNQHKTSILP